MLTVCPDCAHNFKTRDCPGVSPRTACILTAIEFLVDRASATEGGVRAAEVVWRRSVFRFWARTGVHGNGY